MNKIQTYFQEDPTNNSEGFYSDIYGKTYFNKKGTKKIYCQYHKRTQLDHIEGWLFCWKCNKDKKND